MKRPRNMDCGKIRRPLKRSKITDGIYGSTFLYLRFLLIWALVLMADFILQFRFEYLWPFWLMVRSVYDSFKYQGLAFSVYFVCIAITSDVICYLFIPVQWLFFAASTYVWVQYVWHTERGICLPTILLWLLFIYIEASVRLRELKSLPFNLDLCRPFACHCIGYPVVTLGFGFKSYVSYRLRLRRQKVIHKENDFYLQILQQALPVEIQFSDSKPKALPSKTEEEVVSNGVTNAANKKVSSSSKLEEEKDTSMNTVKTKSSKNNDANEDDEVDYMERNLPHKSSNISQLDESNDSVANEQVTGKGLRVGNGVVASIAQTAASSVNVPSVKSSSKQFSSNKENYNSNSAFTNLSSISSSSSKKGKNVYKELQPSASPVTYTNNKDEVIQRLETDVRKLKADLQASRNCEHELRSQISSSASTEKAMHSEMYQLQQDNENLQNKLHSLVTSRQQDKQTITNMEKKLTDERKLRAALEMQLANEKKSKSVEAAARAVAMANTARGECTDACKARRREFDNEIKQIRHENKMWEEQYRQLEREIQSLRQYRDAQKDTEVLMKALSSMQDKNVELENNLSAETRFKQDLFSALGKERNEIKILQNIVGEKDSEILELKSKIAEVMALIPSPAVTTYSHHSHERNSSPLFSSNFSPAQDRTTSLFNGSDLVSASELNPNASDYTPKSAM